MRNTNMQNKQRGFTLIEILGSLAIGSVMLAGLAALIDSSQEDAVGQQAALYQAQVVDAARKYISANYQSLVTATPNAATVVPVSVATLKSQNFLSAEFALTNAYNQSACVLVRQPVVGSGKIDAVIATSGGRKIPDREIPAVATSAGQGSGYIAASAPTTARGPSWSLDTTPFRGVACGGGAPVLTGGAADGGHLASNLFYDGPGQLSTDFLYRSAVPGRPELNQMNTPLKLANSAVVTVGSACGTVAAIAADAVHDLLKCGSDGLWSYLTTWKNPVASFAALPTTDNNGDVRMALDKKRAFMFDKPNNKWVALAVDQNGDLAVTRDINVGRDVNVVRDVNAGGDVVVAGDVNAGNDVVAGNEVNGITGVRGGYLEIVDYAEFSSVTIKDSVAPGSACNLTTSGGFIMWPVGTVVVDFNGLPMSCYKDHTFRYPNGKTTP
jgi:prepilin-type N-terminal cleavage/methylation domain-containing protein